ncbi:hypothetical protein AgCh_026605 [Apium graveolens]
MLCWGSIDYFDYCDADHISLIEIGHMLKEVGKIGYSKLWYRLPGTDMERECAELDNDEEVMLMCTLMPKEVVIVDSVHFAMEKTGGKSLEDCRWNLISLPESVGSHPPSLHQFDQSIAYFVLDRNSNAYEIWVLKINESSWEKRIRISLRENIRLPILGTRNNGEPILAELYNLISYNLPNHEPEIFVNSWNLWEDFPNYDSGDNDYENDPGPSFFIHPFVKSPVLHNI